MFAMVNATIYAPGQWEAGQAQREEFWALLAAQPGMHGALRLDAGASRFLNLLVWEQQAQWAASRPVVEAAGARLTIPLFATPLQQLGAGEVVRNTITPGATPGFARLGESTYALDRLAAGQAQVDEFWAIRAALPGFLGTIEVDAGAGRSLALSLWASAAQQQAAAPTLAPAVERLLAPLLAAPQRVLGLGAVVYDSLTTRV